MLRTIFYYTLIALLLTLSDCFERYEHVITNQGRLRGKTKRVLGKDLVMFLGVPFAKPPVNELRFRPPERLSSWTGTVDALSLSRACIQPRDNTFPDYWGSEMWNPNTPQDEDCLYLNMWYPKGIQNATVMVWIFGGGFYYGSPSLDVYNGEGLAAQGDVIVINVNYRVGALGFLYLGTSDCPGNVGLLDQQMALKWIQENIHHFGGDPKKVSLFGESAGAASVVAHMIAPGSRDLWNYGILQSGSIQNPWAMDTPKTALTKSLAFTKFVLCADEDVSASVKCLRNLPVDSFTDELWGSSFVWHFMEFPLVIVSEDQYFFRGKNAFQALREGDLKKTNVIVGVNKDEGTFWMTYYLANYFGKDKTGLVDREAYLVSVETALDREPSFVKSAAKFEYDPDRTCEKVGNVSTHAYTYAVNQLVGDYQFTCDSMFLADQVNQLGGTSFVYHLSHTISSNPWPEWMGVMHAYEIEFVFGIPLVNTTHTKGRYTPQEQQLSKEIIGYWTSFAETGIPEYSGSKTIWESYRPGQKSYLELSIGMSHLLTGLKESECKFWNEIRDMHHRLEKSGAPVQVSRFFILLILSFFLAALN